MSPTRLVHITTVPLSLMFLRGQGRYLASRGYDVHVASSPGEDLYRYGKDEGVTAHAVPIERQIHLLRDLIALARLTLLLRTLRPTVVHAHTPKAGLLAMVAARILRVPVRIYHIHGLPFESTSGARRHLLRACEYVACHLATSVMCVSRSTLHVAIHEGLCPPHRGVVLLSGTINGIDATVQFNPALPDRTKDAARKALGLDSNAVVIGYVGRIVTDKGSEILAHTWRGIRDQYPDAYLLIVGQPDGSDKLTDTLMAEWQADERVILAGWVREPAPYYAAMDVLAFPTFREGFGLAALEAGAMCVPTVATRIAGCVDAVIDGVTGTLVAARSKQAFEWALCRYLDDAALREIHGNAARQRVLAEFRREAMWDALGRHYASLLDGSG